MHILYIVGNRPQFIKLAVMHKKVKQYSFIKETIIHTGQHFSNNMSDIFFKDLTIELPIINLFIHSLSHVALIGKTMEALEVQIKKETTDFIVVFGDTNATLAGALTAKKMNIPLVHIEAGIRTFDENMPEESNRYLTDRLADLNFCCTYLGHENLIKEGFNGSQILSKIINSGDLMLDAFRYFENAHLELKSNLKDLGLVKQQYVLTTLHRRQNIENVEALSNIIAALNAIHKEIHVVCPLHPNTQNILNRHGQQCDFQTIPPQGYLQMQQLLSKSKYVITDSGGLQREAFFAQKPVLILMEQPFWPEIVAHGNATASPSKMEAIYKSFVNLQKMNRVNDVSIFGNGDAAKIIVEEMIAFYNCSI